MARTKRKLATIVHDQDEAVEEPSRGLSTQHPTEELGGVADGGATTVEGGEGSTPTTLRRTRGPTKMKEIWKLPNNTKIVVECNGHNQPVGDGGRKLGKFCSVIARNLRILPLSYKSWSKVPTTTKATAIDAIKKEARKLIEERSSSSTADRIQCQAMTDVFYRPGRVRGMGLRPTPSQVLNHRYLVLVHLALVVHPIRTCSRCRQKLTA